MKIGRTGENFSVERSKNRSQIPGGHVRAADAATSKTQFASTLADPQRSFSIAKKTKKGRSTGLSRDFNRKSGLLHRLAEGLPDDAGLPAASSGVQVLLLEKDADFLRDFRGDTIHPSTLELMHELGILKPS
jgi:hypothetical protein